MKQRIIALIKSEGFAYLFFGGLATLLNLVLFALLKQFIPYQMANLLTLVIVIVFAYITNKLFVFKSKTTGFAALVREMASFFAARLLTLVLDYYGLILMVDVLYMDEMVAKIILQALVIVLNYVLSKLLIFTKKK